MDRNTWIIFIRLGHGKLVSRHGRRDILGTERCNNEY